MLRANNPFQIARMPITWEFNAAWGLGESRITMRGLNCLKFWNTRHHRNEFCGVNIKIVGCHGIIPLYRYHSDLEGYIVDTLIFCASKLTLPAARTCNIKEKIPALHRVFNKLVERSTSSLHRSGNWPLKIAKQTTTDAFFGNRTH